MALQPPTVPSHGGATVLNSRDARHSISQYLITATERHRGVHKCTHGYRHTHLQIQIEVDVDRHTHIHMRAQDIGTKGKLHTDTYTRTYTDTDSAVISSESTEAEPQENLKPPLPQMSNLQSWLSPRAGHNCAGERQ